MSARRPHGQSYADVAAKPPPASNSDITPAVPACVILQHHLKLYPQYMLISLTYK